MHLLILTQYYPPEVGAPQNRLSRLAGFLRKNGFDVSILTAMPNYPRMKIAENYRSKLYFYEVMEGIPVHRSWIYTGNSHRIFLRLVNYFSFVITSLLTGWIKLHRVDLIFCESPPLFLGITGYLLAKLKRAKLVFNVSDLWPESAEKLGLVTNRILLASAAHLESFLYRKSLLVTGQTQGIVTNISARFPDKEVIWLKNGMDFSMPAGEYSPGKWRTGQGFHPDDFLLIYAGIIGYAQGLEIILQSASVLESRPDIKFILVGNGPVKDELIAWKRDKNLPNVFFFESMPRHEVIPVIRDADVALIPLRPLDLFRGAIPSKILEALWLKKPILLGVKGEATSLFIDQAKAGRAYEPGDPEDFTRQVLILSAERNNLTVYGENGFTYIRSEFSMDKIAQQFCQRLREIPE